MPYSYLGTNASFSIYGHRNDRIGRYESKKNRETAFKPFSGNLMAFLFIYRIFNPPSSDQSNAPRAGDEHSDIDLRGSQHVHRGCGELRSGLLVL
jgi:hypothetical protein